MDLKAVLHILSTGRSTCLLNSVPSASCNVNPACVHTLTPPYDILAEPKGLRGGVGSPGEMTTSWASSEGVRICWREEPPGSSEEIIREPFGLLTTSARCWTTGEDKKHRWAKQCVNSAPVMSSCWLWVNTALHGRSCELVSGPAILPRITGPCGGGGFRWKGP